MHATRAGWFFDFGRDLGVAARSLRRTPAFTLVTIVSLGLGFSLATTTLAITHAYLIRALPYPDGARLYHVRYAPPGPYEPRGMTALDWKSLDDVIDAAVTTGGESFYVGEFGPLAFVRATRVSRGAIEGLGVRPILGSVFAEDDYKPGGPPVALIGHALWREHFNSDPKIVGRELRAMPENQTGAPILIRVVGVLPPGLWFGRTSDARVEMLTPLRAPARTYLVRLRAGVPVAHAERRITEAARVVGSDFRPGWEGVKLESMHARYVAELRPLLLGINVATALVVLLVCINVAILVLLRTLRRQKEVAVRVALGAEPRHLLRLLIAEAGWLCAGALGLAIGLTAVGLRTLAPVIEARLGRPPPAGSAAIGVDWPVVAMIGGVGLVVALSLAFAPLMASRRRAVADDLRRSGAGATDGPTTRRLRGSLIALEVAGAFALLTGSGLMVRTVLNLVRTDFGFDAGQVVRVSVVLPGTFREPEEMARFWEKLAARIAGPGPGPALGGSFPPFYESHKRPMKIDAAPDREQSMGGLNVGAGYFAVHGIEVKQGREFTLADRVGAEPVAVVSESLARSLWPEGSPIGRRLQAIEESVPDAPWGPWRTVVGVVRDVRQTYGDADLRDVYVPFLQSPTRFGSVQFRTDRADAITPLQLAGVVAGLDPFVRVGQPQLLADLDQQFARAGFMTGLLAGFAGFATLLAGLGIYGVTAFAVQQRHREIAIRVAVGATRAAVVRLFIRDSVPVLAGGVGLGLLAALATNRVIENQIHGVRPFDLFTLTAAAALLVVCSIAASAWPARRAAAGALLVVLKEE